MSYTTPITAVCEYLVDYPACRATTCADVDAHALVTVQGCVARIHYASGRSITCHDPATGRVLRSVYRDERGLVVVDVCAPASTNVTLIAMQMRICYEEGLPRFIEWLHGDFLRRAYFGPPRTATLWLVDGSRVELDEDAVEVFFAAHADRTEAAVLREELQAHWRRIEDAMAPAA